MVAVCLASERVRDGQSLNALSFADQVCVREKEHRTNMSCGIYPTPLGSRHHIYEKVEQLVVRESERTRESESRYYLEESLISVPVDSVVRTDATPYTQVVSTLLKGRTFEQTCKSAGRFI